LFLSIGDAGSNKLQNGGFDFVFRKAGGIEIHRVGSLYEGRFNAAAIAFVAGSEFSSGFAGAAADAFIGVGVEKDFDAGIREDDGSDVAAFHYDAGGFRDQSLACHKGGSNESDGRDFRCARGHLGRADSVADVFAVENDFVSGQKADIGREGELFEAMRVGEVDFFAQSPESHGAVHGSGIDVNIAEFVCHAARKGAFARSGGTVDRNYVAQKTTVSQGVGFSCDDARL